MQRTAVFTRKGVVERVRASARLEGGEISPELDAVLVRYEESGDSNLIIEYMNDMLATRGWEE